MTKDRLIKRLSWYYPAELSGAIAFSCYLFLAFIFFPFNSSFSLLYGLFVLSFILWQGQFYWKVKLKSLKGQEINQKQCISLFKTFKFINQILIFIIPFLFAFQLYLSNWTITSKLIFGLAIASNLLAILEYINYFVKQLMIDNKNDIIYLKKNKKLKTPGLIKDLRENRF